VNVSNPAFDASNIRLAQELRLVQYMQQVALTNGVWKSPAAVDFEPYSSTAFWITQYDSTKPAAPVQAAYTLPDRTVDPIPVAIQVGSHVVIRWQYLATDPVYYSFFYFEVARGDEIISPQPQQTRDGVPTGSFALRAAIWVDTAPPVGNTYTYTIRVVSASGIKSDALTSPPVTVS
jgi:hypothetical protein